jgi:hypothetical protein
VRVNYTGEENLRLVSAWLKHSIDPICGIVRVERRTGRV